MKENQITFRQTSIIFETFQACKYMVKKLTKNIHYDRYQKAFSLVTMPAQ